MKGASQFLMLASSFAAAPFLVVFVSEFFGGGYPWLPYLIVLLIGGVLYAVGVVRGASVGLIVGVIVFAALLLWYRPALSWMPSNVRTVPPPF